ncbi:PqiC family protein [Thalassospira sp. MA62]|nr:PqiC family protein [Thalassospira sp. MA62]
MMRRTIFTQLRTGLLVACVAPILAACAASSVPDQYYLLSAPDAPSAPAMQNAPVVGVGPITIPSHLDRSVIVARSSQNRIDVKTGHRWAEPLEENISRVILENIDHTGVASRLEAFPWTSRDGVDWQISVDIERFEQQGDGKIVLAARWKLVSFADGQIIAAKRYEKSTSAVGTTIEDTVSAMSNLLTDMSQEISRTVP